MSKCIALIHSTTVIIDAVGKVFKRVYPEAELINIMDDSLLRDIKQKGAIDYLGTRRICRYALTGKAIALSRAVNA